VEHDVVAGRNTVLRRNRTGARALAISLLTAAVIATAAMPAVAVVAPAAAESAFAGGGAARVIAIAKAQIGDPWRYSATGPNAFDCSGLVTYAFREAGQLSRIGGGTYRSASSLYAYFSRRGLASRHGGRVGDLVIYGGGAHVGVYLGNGRVISTLTSGVRVHGLYAVYSRFTAFLHTGLSGHVSAAGHAPRTKSKAKATTHRPARHQPAKRKVAIRPRVHALAIPGWTGSSLGPTGAVAGMGAVGFEQTLSDPTGMIARDVRREARAWRATVAAQDGVTDARLARISPGERLTTVRSSIGSDRTWLVLQTPGGRRTWVASERTRR
jgi:cell wall-associated NlpC family hydrolase